MANETLTAVREFMKSFEEVFGSDWAYTMDRLGISPPTAQDIAEEKAGESIPCIAQDGTFIDPKADVEDCNWGYREALLERYRRLKQLIDTRNTEQGTNENLVQPTPVSMVRLTPVKK